MILGISGYIIYIKLGLKKNLVKKETKEVYSGQIKEVSKVAGKDSQKLEMKKDIGVPGQ